MGEYPGQLRDLFEPPAEDERAAHWQGPYLHGGGEPDLKDSRGRTIRYRCPGVQNPETYDLFTLEGDGMTETYNDTIAEPSPP